MTEKSMLWAAPSTGDGVSAYTSNEIVALMRALFGDGAGEGVIPGFDNALAVSGTASPLSVATGAALVYGLFYWNDAAKNITITTPSVGTTGHRIVLRADWTARTVRAVDKASADGTAAIPALTQTPGSTYEISLATFTITTGGVITLTDDRTYLYFGGQVQAFDPEIVSDTEAGNNVPFLAKRQGGSTTNWSTIGTTSYTPAKVLVQAGHVILPALPNYTSEDYATVTFPIAYKSGTVPLVIVTSHNQGLNVCAYGNDNATAIVSGKIVSGAYYPNDTPDVFWIAIGERA